jgi:hypothetical protein
MQEQAPGFDFHLLMQTGCCLHPRIGSTPYVYS